MKQILKSKTGTVILACAGGLVVAVVLSSVLGLDQWWQVRGAIRDIAGGSQKEMAKARATLEVLDNRQYVLRKLKEGVEDDSLGVRAKVNFLTTLKMLNDPRALPRALDSGSVTAQRAACSLLYGDAEKRTRCGEIALAWLKDAAAEDRSMAAFYCGQLDLKEAQPVLLEIAQRDPRTEQERDLLMRALNAIDDPKPQELVERLLRIAGDPAQHDDLRGIALESLQRMKDGPRDQVLALSIAILGDESANPILRAKAALGLRDFPEDRAWEALEAVLLSDKEKNSILQRNCLLTLGSIEPKDPEVAKRYIDRLKKLLLDRRVYHHKYFAIRVDVATALAALNVREPITFDIMCDYLVNEDKDDRQHIVREEGWLTLWVLTGTKFDDVPEPELWQMPPPAFPDPLAAREFFFRRGQLRPGITSKQAEMAAKIATDLPYMQKTRQVYQGLKGKILEQWRAAAEKGKPEPPKKEEGQGEPEKVEPAGPQRPEPPPGNAVEPPKPN